MYRIRNKDKLSQYFKNKRKSFLKTDYYVDKLTLEEDPIFKEGYLWVRCKYCKEYFKPTYSNLKSRVNIINNNISSATQNFLFCSDECKDSCGLYNLRSDPALQTIKQKARSCQKESKYALLALQIDEFGYNYCDRCGKQFDSVELHHTEKVSECPEQSISARGHMLVCKDCHDDFTYRNAPI